MFDVRIHTTDNRGHNPEELAQMCVEKLIHISDNAPPAIQEQARAFQNEMRSVITYYIEQGVRSDRTTVYNAILDAGQPKLAELIRRM
jgi:hypothetical protein